jgi:hypothetical protein
MCVPDTCPIEGSDTDRAVDRTTRTTHPLNHQIRDFAAAALPSHAKEARIVDLG